MIMVVKILHLIFAYAETANPTVDGFKLEVGKNGDGNYQGKLTGLKTETKYYIKAYATNSNGTSYGDEIEVTTTDGLPVVVTVGSRDIESDKAVLTGTITSNGGQILHLMVLCSVKMKILQQKIIK